MSDPRIANLSVGLKLRAQYTDGEFYPAEIVAISESKNRKKAPIKVHYQGYGEADDAWLSLESLRSKKLPKMQVEPKAKAKAKVKAKAKEKKERKLKPIKLTYFNIEGAAEKVRLAFTIGKIDFEDERIGFDAWPELKPKTKYGQLPMMQIGDNEPFAQSGAMLRYAGRIAGLYPQSLLLKIEEAIGLEEDIGKDVTPSMYIGMRPHLYGYPEDMPKEESSKIQLSLREKLIAKDGDLTTKLGYLEKFIGDEPYMCGKKVTIADCQVIQRLRHLTKGILDGIPTTILDDFPKLSAYFKRFHEIPEVKAWYDKPPK